MNREKKFFFQNILRYMLLFNKWDRRLFLEGFFFLIVLQYDLPLSKFLRTVRGHCF